MTEQCPNCGKERADGQDYCLTSGCGWHFAGDIIVDPQSMDSYVKSKEKREEHKKEMEKEQEAPKSEPEFFKERDENASDPTFVRSESEWEKDRKEMEAESELSQSDYSAKVVDRKERNGILVLPGGKEILVEDNEKTVGRNDVSEFMELNAVDDPRKVSSQQFTIFRLPSQSTALNAGYDYFIEDRQTSVQTKQSMNGTKVNGENISGHVSKELHDGDKIEFACISGCVATFQFR